MGKLDRYIDISVPLRNTTTVFPGDPSPRIHWPGWSHDRGDPATVGFYAGGLHHGTHVDAPCHFIRHAKTVDQLDLDYWLGACTVIDLTHETRCVSAASLEQQQIDGAVKRVLFKTRNSLQDYWQQPWKPDFIYIHRSAAEWCVFRGIKTVGLDYLTIDSPSEPDFPSHMILLGNDVCILENINLRDVPGGTYELVAAPVHLVGTDGAWCRALLRKETPPD